MGKFIVIYVMNRYVFNDWNPNIFLIKNEFKKKIYIKKYFFLFLTIKIIFVNF